MFYLGNKLSGYYEVGTAKHDWSRRRGFTKSYLTSFCKSEFERMTGIRLKPGELVKVTKIVTKKVK